jgi:hypothetical protein
MVSQIQTEIVLDVADAEKPEEIQIETLEKYAEEFTREILESVVTQESTATKVAEEHVSIPEDKPSIDERKLSVVEVMV